MTHPQPYPHRRHPRAPPSLALPAPLFTAGERPGTDLSLPPEMVNVAHLLRPTPLNADARDNYEAALNDATPVPSSTNGHHTPHHTSRNPHGAGFLEPLAQT